MHAPRVHCAPLFIVARQRPALYTAVRLRQKLVRINKTEEQNMRRIKTLTRPKVNYALVHQGLVLTILEKQLRDMLSNLRDTMDKAEE
jgi:hypothetical protein